MLYNNYIKNLLTNLPKKIGVYRFYDKENQILYIGKAKNLKSRISSYFIKRHVNNKTRILVSKIHEIKYVVVSTEIDALLLENNLIKKYQPKYNVLLKDGKTYPWICITNDKIPRIIQTRDLKRNLGEYFGPYMSTHIVKTLLDFFSDLFYNQGWTPITYLNRKINNNAELKNYLAIIDDVRKILRGNINVLIKDLKKPMLLHAHNLNFEDAQIIKQKITLLKNYQSKSVIVNPKISDVDVFTIIKDKKVAFVNYLKIKSGAVIQAHTMEIKSQLDETEQELLHLAIVELRERFNSVSKEIYCSHNLKNIWDNLKIFKPRIGDKKKLIDLSLRNAKYMLLDKKKRKINNTQKQKTIQILEKLKKDLHLKDTPIHIECFDNSNIQGAYPVAACVVFINAKPSKKNYRNYNIKSVVGPDDFASMEEVVYRRYQRLLKENKTLPQLIIVDGGKGQLSSALKSLKKLNLQDKIAVIGIAKRLEKIFLPEDPIPIYLDKRSQSLRLIQQLRDEAHRFGISHHRQKRLKKYFVTSLNDIDGIGPKTIEVLISHFGSVEKVNASTNLELEKIIGKKRAKLIQDFRK